MTTTATPTSPAPAPPASHAVPTPLGVYLLVFAALLVLTGATVGIAYLDLGGHLNIIAAITIAALKGLLVLLYFMHLRHASHLLWVFAIMGLFWLMILIGLTFADYGSRDWLG